MKHTMTTPKEQVTMRKVNGASYEAECTCGWRITSRDGEVVAEEVREHVGITTAI